MKDLDQTKPVGTLLIFESFISDDQFVTRFSTLASNSRISQIAAHGIIFYTASDSYCHVVGSFDALVARYTSAHESFHKFACQQKCTIDS